MMDHTYFVAEGNKPPSVSTCEICGKKYVKKNSWFQHMKLSHNKRSPGSKRCLECPESFFGSRSLVEHLRETHKYQIDIVTQVFNSLNEFLDWKTDYESNNNVRFVRRPTNASSGAVYFYCNRSGTHKSQSSGLRAAKKKGSCKSGFHCTAFITATIKPKSGRVLTKMCLTHYGHEIEIRHVGLTREHRRLIADKVAQGLSKDDILREVKDSVLPNGFNRFHLINRKDISNIIRSNNLAYNPSDLNSVSRADQLKNTKEIFEKGRKALESVLQRVLAGEFSDEKLKAFGILIENFIADMNRLANPVLEAH